MRKTAAVFLDRDGTIIEDRGTLRNTEEVTFFPETFEALRRLAQQFRLFLVTHQAFFTSNALQNIAQTTLENIRLIEQGKPCPNRVSIPAET